MTNWKNDLEQYNDNFEAININGKMYLGNKVKTALRVLSREFDSGYSNTNDGQSFYAWSIDWIYFCVVYNGEEYIDRVPRDPYKMIPKYVGGLL